jgi:hypothetical protein
MHKRDFILLANAIAGLPGVTSRPEVAHAIAAAIKPTNKRFEHTRFLAACQPARLGDPDQCVLDLLPE